MTSTDLTTIFQNNKITRFSKKYINMYNDKIKERFITEEEKLFVSYFYNFFDIDTTEYYINLDDIWKWIGFSTKGNAKRTLTKNFKENIDYKIIYKKNVENSKGGRPKEYIFMNKLTFELFYCKSNIDKYFIFYNNYSNLKEIYMNILFEHSNYLQIEIAKMNKTEEELQKETKKMEKEIEDTELLINQIETKFTKSIEDLLKLHSTKKGKLLRHIKKNYKENIHYITFNNNDSTTKGGRPKIECYITEEAFDLINISFNFRNKYIPTLSNNIKCINVIMSLETQTIGFIANSFMETCNIQKQHKIGKYKVDLYFLDYKLVVECDENNHNDRNPIQEKIREDYILSLNNTIIRFNPNDENFDLSFVLQKINQFLFKKNNDLINTVIRINN